MLPGNTLVSRLFRLKQVETKEDTVLVQNVAVQVMHTLAHTHSPPHTHDDGQQHNGAAISGVLELMLLGLSIW